MSSQLKLFTCTEFEGHYPVGVAAVVLAVDETQAAAMLEEVLCITGLPQAILPTQLEEVSLLKPSVQILCNGDY